LYAKQTSQQNNDNNENNDNNDNNDNEEAEPERNESDEEVQVPVRSKILVKPILTPFGKAKAPRKQRSRARRN